MWHIPVLTLADMGQDQEDLQVLVDLAGTVEPEQEGQVDQTDPVDQTDQANPVDQDHASSEDAGEEVVAVVDMVDPQSA